MMWYSVTSKLLIFCLASSNSDEIRYSLSSCMSRLAICFNYELKYLPCFRIFSPLRMISAFWKLLTIYLALLSIANCLFVSFSFKFSSLFCSNWRSLAYNCFSLSCYFSRLMRLVSSISSFSLSSCCSQTCLALIESESLDCLTYKIFNALSLVRFILCMILRS